MKEITNRKLANPSQTPYSKGVPRFDRGGDIFMEGKPDMTPARNQQPANPEHTERIPAQNQPRIRGGLTPEAFEAVWENYLGTREAQGKIPSDEMQTLKIMRESGIPPIGGATQQPEEPIAETGGTAQSGQNILDAQARSLVQRFNQEGGSQSRERIQQFRNDLSLRIDELMREQWVLGDSPDVATPEGKARIDAQIDELNNRISQIQGIIAEMFPRQERGWRDPLVGRLVEESQMFVDALLGRGLRIDQVNDLTKLTQGERTRRFTLVREIKAFIENSPSLESSSFNSDILLAVRHFKELREELVSDIMFKSFQDRSETNEYEVNLYADSNLNTLLGFMNKDDNERYRYFFSLRTATRFFQSMNATVLKGTFDSFGHSAENINYQHFENMRDIRGSGLAMRLYEQAYKDILAQDKRVTQDKIARIKEYVETTFKEMNEAGLITSEYVQYREDSKMEDWEIQRALAAGRSFLNITLRAAENIATGQVPSDRKRYTSPPQEDMVRILNWNQWLLARFTVGGGTEGRHGEEFLKMTTDKYQEFLRYKGAKLGANKITEFGGVDVRKMEDGSQYKTSGVYSGWRLENMAFNEIAFDYNGRRFTIQEFRDQSAVKDRVKEIKDRIERRKTANPSADPKNLVTEEDQREYRDVLMPVINNLNFALSMLLKNGDFGAQDNKLGYLLREEIWKKIARTNVPLMIDYLTDIKYADGTPKADKAESIQTLRSNLVPEWNDEQWEIFRKKVLVRFERTIKEGMLREGEILSPLDSRYELDPDERSMEDAIKREAVKLAPHLADIIFPYTPFMNDMPFEKFQYQYAGQTFYKRRTTGDLGGFNKGQNAYTKILSNPGGIPAKDAVQAMGEIVAGIEGPEGPRTGIESNFPTFNALLDVVTTDPGKRQAMFKMLLEVTRKETSIAQRWQGIKADSFTESEAANLIDDTLRAGILTPELARYLKKEKHLTLPFILWMLFRDVFILMPVYSGSALWDATKTK